MEIILLIFNGIIVILGIIALRKDTNTSKKLLLTSIVVLSTISLVGYFLGKSLVYMFN